jgi:hypothetical protein
LSIDGKGRGEKKGESQKICGALQGDGVNSAELKF